MEQMVPLNASLIESISTRVFRKLLFKFGAKNNNKKVCSWHHPGTNAHQLLFPNMINVLSDSACGSHSFLFFGFFLGTN